MPAEICPYLGVKEDAQTCLSYPSPWNVCHHCKPLAAVKLKHQSSICLSSEYHNCSVFQKEAKAPLPSELREQGTVTSG